MKGQLPTYVELECSSPIFSICTEAKYDILCGSRIDFSHHHSQCLTCKVAFFIHTGGCLSLSTVQWIFALKFLLTFTLWEGYTFLLYWCWTWQCNMLGPLEYICPHFDFGLRQLTCFTQWYGSRDDASKKLDVC